MEEIEMEKNTESAKNIEYSALNFVFVDRLYEDCPTCKAPLATIQNKTFVLEVRTKSGELVNTRCPTCRGTIIQKG
jgi:uncharacterized protein with PIN domain